MDSLPAYAFCLAKAAPCAAAAIAASCLAAFIALVVAAVCDLWRRIIPNACVLVMLASWAVLVPAASLMGGPCSFGERPDLLPSFIVMLQGNVFRSLALSAAGFVLIGVLPLACALALERRCGAEACIGGGDLKLLGVLGLWLGPIPGLSMLLLACILVLAVQGLRRLARGRAGPFPFAPYLACSYVLIASGAII